MTTYHVDYINGSDSNDGLSWGAAFKSITYADTLVAPGDTVKIAKSGPPVTVGTATWTNNSEMLTLDTAGTVHLFNCDTTFDVIDGKAFVENNTGNMKEGTAFTRVYAYDTGIIAYKTITEVDLSSFDTLSFWFMCQSSALNTGDFVLNLCSDTGGTSVVDQISIPGTNGNTYNNLIMLRDLHRIGGGNFGASIKSISVSATVNNKDIWFDNIFATTTGNIQLGDIITKGSGENNFTDSYHAIQYVDGVNVKLDTQMSYSYYKGPTENVETYKRTPFFVSSAESIYTAGSQNNLIYYEGGYDTGSDIQTGLTIICGANLNYASALNLSTNYISLHNLGFFNFYQGIFIGSYYSNNYGLVLENIRSDASYYYGFYSSVTSSTYNNIFCSCIGNSFFYFKTNFSTVTDLTVTNCGNSGALGIYGFNSTLNNVTCTYNNSNGLVFGSGSQGNIINSLTSENNNGYGVLFGDPPTFGPHISSGTNIVRNLVTNNNANGSIISYGLKNVIQGNTSSEGTLLGTIPVFSGNYLSFCPPGGYVTTYADGGLIEQQSSTLTNGSGSEWKITTQTDTTRTLAYPIVLPVAKIAVVADETLTVKIWMKKDHATDIGARLVIKGGQISGVDNDVYTEATDTTDEQQVEVSILPTDSGVIQVEVWTFYINGHSNVIVDNITTTQAV